MDLEACYPDCKSLFWTNLLQSYPIKYLMMPKSNSCSDLTCSLVEIKNFFFFKHGRVLWSVQCQVSTVQVIYQIYILSKNEFGLIGSSISEIQISPSPSIFFLLYKFLFIFLSYIFSAIMYFSRFSFYRIIKIRSN